MRTAAAAFAALGLVAACSSPEEMQSARAAVSEIRAAFVPMNPEGSGLSHLPAKTVVFVSERRFLTYYLFAALQVGFEPIG